MSRSLFHLSRMKEIVFVPVVLERWRAEFKIKNKLSLAQKCMKKTVKISFFIVIMLKTSQTIGSS